MELIGCGSHLSYKHLVLMLAYSLLELWIGKTKITDANSLLEILWNLFFKRRN